MSERDFVQVDVFGDRPYTGNPLAVFFDAGGLTAAQMQALAAEMNLSETSFVTAVDRSSYRVRIFTPKEELPFAGHPTLGTAWVLRHLGRLEGDEVQQQSAAGATEVRFEHELVWLRRTGTAAGDLGQDAALANALGLEQSDLTLDAAALGRAGVLRPATADAGVEQLLVPLAHAEVLRRCAPNAADLESMSLGGAYCFAVQASGRVGARGFWPGFGVSEDPATGSAAASLGLYLSDRLGAIGIEIDQGVEMGRPSQLSVRAADETVDVGGRCHLVLAGRVEQLPRP